jgi:GT2 family glycosyltransferase
VTAEPDLAIVICSRDRPAFLRDALAAIQAVKRPTDEVVFVDSASTDPAVADVAGSFSGFTIVRCDRPGLARARNRGVLASNAPVIVFTDDDCRPEPGWTDVLGAVFRAEPKLGFVTGRVVADRDEGPKISVGGGDEPRTFEFGVDPAELGHGANFAVRREAIEAVGGFDEVLGVGARFRGAEDHDAFWRILRAGWVGRYEPRATVVHRQWRTRRQYLRSEYGYGLGSGAFGVKAVRLQGRDGARILQDTLWKRGIRSSARALRRGYETAAAADALRFAGSVVGALRASRMRLDGSRYVVVEPGEVIGLRDRGTGA